MCGIVGYIGKEKKAEKVVIEGLYRLEYRGYDSAGLAFIEDGGIKVLRAKGAVKGLDDKCSSVQPQDLAIGHTRWATHGKPSEENAHPHKSFNGKLAIVHNGIIENYKHLKEKLKDEGYFFNSETDTEVLANWIEHTMLSNELSLEDAVHEALKYVHGAYAICVVEPTAQMIVCAKKSSPLAVGIGEDSFVIGSDATPIIGRAKEVIYLEDDQIAVVTREKLQVKDVDNRETEFNPEKLLLDLQAVEKKGFESFMMKEIHEQPETIADCLRGRLAAAGPEIALGGIEDQMPRLLRAKKITIIACGTSWHSALIGKYLLERLTRIPVEVDYASEYRYRRPIITADDVVIGITQSGETADTKAALELAKEKGALILGIVNVVGSSIARLSHAGIYTHSGTEIGVASTKAFTGQVTALTLLAIKLSHRLGHIDDDKLMDLKDALEKIPDQVQDILADQASIESVANIYSSYDDFLYLGRGVSFPVALEGALKLKEISYIHAEGYPAGEMKHGPIALIDESCPSVFVMPHDDSYEKTISNLQEIRARSGKVIAITDREDKNLTEIADAVIIVPETEPELTPLLTTIPLQIISHKIAVVRCKNVDKPRNLAKSVTVE
jgi:glucosamine--fructose-6-phosphate aminotransferase (isomerizing)